MKILYKILLFVICLIDLQKVHAQGVSSTLARKPVVAVYELKDLAGTGQAEAFLTMVQTAITTTNRFRVIERDFSVLTAEQNNANSGQVTSRTPGRRGGFEGADYLIYGTITQGQNQSRVDTGCKIGTIVFGYGGASCQQNTASLSVDIRIVDSHTGQLFWAKTIRQDTKGHVMLAGESRIDYIDLLRNAAQNIATGLTLALYPVKVAGLTPDGTVILNFGSDFLKVGDYMQIVGVEGACAAVDPDTHECLTKERNTLGTVLIYEVSDKFSRGRPVMPFAQAPVPGSIARLIDPPADDSKRRRH